MAPKRSVEFLFDVPNEIIDKVKKQIGEDQARMKHIEDLLEQWMQSEPHLPNNYDRQMARNFIRGAKFSLETTKRKLESYFLVKFAFPEFYQNRNPLSQDILRTFDAINIVFLPQLTKNGERICVMSLANPDLAVFDMVSNVKLFWMLCDFALTCKFPITSEIIIFDCENASSYHFAKFLCLEMKNSISILRDAYAARISQVHIINCPTMAETIISAVRPLLHEKVKERIITHKGTETLFDYIDQKVLPSDFGGSLKNLRSYMKQWQEVLAKNVDWFKEQEKAKISGKPPKRISKFKHLSLEGSFRKLNID